MTSTHGTPAVGRLLPWSILILSITALAAAFIGQHFFGLVPCVLCLYQRIPYALAALIAVGMITIPLLRRHIPWVIAVCALVFLCGVVLAVFHVGVEQHWWAGTNACTVKLASDLRFEDVTGANPPPLRSCNEPDWFLFGLTLAAYNGILSAVLCITSIAAAAFAGRGGTT